jgi:hypothetical protein
MLLFAVADLLYLSGSSLPMLLEHENRQMAQQTGEATFREKVSSEEQSSVGAFHQLFFSLDRVTQFISSDITSSET